MKKIIYCLPLLSLLAACHPPLTRDQQLAIYRSRCVDYGYQPGTLEFADCMMRQEERAEKLAIQARKVDVLEEHNWIERQKVWAKEKEVDSKRRKRKK